MMPFRLLKGITDTAKDTTPLLGGVVLDYSGHASGGLGPDGCPYSDYSSVWTAGSGLLTP
jgi:hypothetical protein